MPISCLSWSAALFLEALDELFVDGSGWVCVICSKKKAGVVPEGIYHWKFMPMLVIKILLEHGINPVDFIVAYEDVVRYPNGGRHIRSPKEVGCLWWDFLFRAGCQTREEYVKALEKLSSD